MSAADDFFSSSTSGKSASFAAAGDSIEGVVESMEKQQQTDMDGKPKFWDDGNPAMQLRVGLQTDLRNPELEDDDGVRYLYVRGSMKPESRSLRAAIGSALQAQKASLEIGGRLKVTCVAKAPQPNPKKLSNQFEASYSPPNFFADAPAKPVQTAKPAAAPEATPAAAQQSSSAASPVETAKELMAAGLPDGVIATTTGLPEVAVAALRASLLSA